MLLVAPTDNNNLSYTCSDDAHQPHSGKTELMKSKDGISSLDFELHFTWNENAPTGDMGIKAWDLFFETLHAKSYKKDRYNQFMDFSLTVYVPDGNKFVERLFERDYPYLARSITNSSLDGETWYSFILTTPSAKTFEVVTTKVNTTILDKLHDLKEWDSKSTHPECGDAHQNTVYSKDELDTWYESLNGHELTGRNGDYPIMLPIRINVAVPNVTYAVERLQALMPALGNTFSDIKTSATATGCKFSTATITHNQGYSSSYLDFKTEIRYIENPDAYSETYTVADFVEDLEAVNDEKTGYNYGWSGWWDRHFGIYVENCYLDDYMQNFEDHGVTFHPHERDNTEYRDVSSTAVTDHMWSGGTSGWGFEMLGNLSYTYADCYYAFDWCTWSSDPDTSDTTEVTCKR